MSKKLIAVAAAAALALTGLVGVAPANAASITDVKITFGGATATAGVEDAANIQTRTTSHSGPDDAVTIASDNTDRKVYFGSSTDAATRTAVRMEVLTASAASLTITSTAGVKVSASTTDAAGDPLSVDAGSTSLAGSTTTGNLTYTFFAWTTSTTAGSVTVDSGTSRMTFFVKAKVGPAYNIVNPTFPASLYVGQTDAKVTWQLTDQWGNPVTTGPAIRPTGFGADFAEGTYSATTKLWSSAISAIAQDNVAINIALTADDFSANGFAKPVKSAFKLVAAGDLSAQVATLTTQVATLQSQLDASRLKVNSVTKKRWNNLVLRHRALGGTAKLKR